MKKQTLKKKFKTVEELAAFTMSQSDFAAMMAQEGQSVADLEAKIGAAIAAGAPCNDDGTIPVAKFVGWLVERTK